MHIRSAKISIDIGKMGEKIITHVLSYRSCILSFPIRKSEGSRWCVTKGQGIQQRPCITWSKGSLQSSLLVLCSSQGGQNPLSPSTAFGWVLVLWAERTNAIGGWYLHLTQSLSSNCTLWEETDASLGNSCLKVRWIAEMEWNTRNSDRLYSNKA